MVQDYSAETGLTKYETVLDSAQVIIDPLLLLSAQSDHVWAYTFLTPCALLRNMQ